MRDEDELAWHRYERSLKQRRLSPQTIYGARWALEQLAASLPPGVSLFTAGGGDIEAWLAGIRDAGSYSAATHATCYRRAHAFYAWAARNEYTEASPMARMTAVKEESPLVPLPDPAGMAAVLAACRPRKPTWRDRRDYAILRVLLEAGTPRASEIAGLRLDRLDMRRDQVTIAGKGGLERVIPFGEKTGHALTLHLRARAAHRLAGRPEVFLTKYGPMDRGAVYKIIIGRCRQAGVPPIPPHHWRHFSAHEWALAGGTEGDAMVLFGWRTPAMAIRYGRAAAATRALTHARDAGQGDRL